MIQKLFLSIAFLLTTHCFAQRISAESKTKAGPAKVSTPYQSKMQKEEVRKQSDAINQEALYTIAKDSANSSLDTTPRIKETNITLLLSLDELHASGKMSSFIRAEDNSVAKGVKLKETSLQALDFYEGFQSALNESNPFFTIHLEVFDAHSNDSILRELLKSDDIRRSNIIIGPGTVSGAKIVADYCKRNKIINIQPFIAAKNIASNNPFLVKLEPAIEAHMARIYKTIVDSFSTNKIIIYCSKRERDFTAASAIDSMFRNYNQTAKHKLNYVFVNFGDSTKSVSFRNLSTHITGALNPIVVYCSYDASSIEQTLRSFNRGTAVVFGMPTWVNDDLIRVDYLNNSDFHFTDEFYADTLDEHVHTFANRYDANYNHPASRSSYLGYDVAQYLLFALKLHGYNFAEKGSLIPYKGLGYNFSVKKHLIKTATGDELLDYYTNDAVHQFRVQDYKIYLSE